MRVYSVSCVLCVKLCVMRIKVYTDNRQNKHGQYPVRISVSFMGRRLLTSLGVAMTQTEFDALNGDYLGTGYRRSDCHHKHKELLRLLHSIEDRLEWESQKVMRGEIKAVDVVLSDVVNECKGKPKKSIVKAENISEVFLKFVRSESSKKDLTIGTIRQLNSTLHILLMYDKHLSVGTMASSEWLQRFVEWNIKRGLNNQSVRGTYIRVHWFLMWCYRNDYCGNEFEKYQLELKSVDTKEKLVVFLTMDEIMSIKELKLDGRIGVARDFFLFQCFTGLRCSDVAKLHKTDIQNGTIHIVTQKTGVSLDNRLNKYAIAIVEKYADTPTETLFPKIADYYINRQLRIIGKMAGIDEPVRKIDYRNHQRVEIVVPKWQLLTTHVGRKSFVVNSLDFGLTATQVIGYTGHSSIKAMQPYISISQKKKDSAMDVWNDALTGKNKEDEIENLNRQIELLKQRLDDLKNDNQ